MIAVKRAVAELDADAVERAHLGFAAAVDLRDVDRAGGDVAAAGGARSTAESRRRPPGRGSCELLRGLATARRSRVRLARLLGRLPAVGDERRDPASPARGRSVVGRGPAVDGRATGTQATAARNTTMLTHALTRSAGDGVRRIDAHLLEHEPARGVPHEVEREHLELLAPEAVVDPEEHPEADAGSTATRRGTSGGTSRTAGTDRAGSRGRSRAPTAASSARRTAPG